MAYIDKELFKQDIKMRYCNNCARPNEIKCRACHVDDMLGEIEDAPTANVEEVKHGQWIPYEQPCGMGYSTPNYKPTHYCSNCEGLGWEFYRKCPHCGAKMDGGKAE